MSIPSIHCVSGDLVRATVVKRPSACIKSPYVADIMLEDGSHALCHTPGLGCCGLVEAGKTIYVNASTKSAKTDYTAQLAECTDTTGVYYVGVHPLVSQKAAHALLVDISKEAIWKSEYTLKMDLDLEQEKTRIDYMGVLPNGKKIYVEVKTAMISSECHVEREGRCAVFPDGYRKKKTDTISPRAVKHATMLGKLMACPDTEMCVLLFVVSRDDCEGGLKINSADPIYQDAVRAAIESGVQVRATSLKYCLDGSICKEKEVQVYV